MNEMKQVISSRIGRFAFKELAMSQKAVIIGITSRGIFLLADSKRVLYITSDKYASPLTINVDDFYKFKESLCKDDYVEIRSNDLIFLKSGFKIITSSAKIWRTPKRNRVLAQPPEIRERAKSITRDLQSDVKKSQLLELVLNLFLKRGDPGSSVQLARIQAFQKEFSSKITDKAVAAILPFIGEGQGLTPSGDDFMCGVLLILNRWKAVLQPGIDLKRFNSRIIDHAKANTTALSANLIELAVKGQTDERLIGVVDYLFTGEGRIADVRAALLSYGSSSGLDTFSGMTTILLT
jgi:hypothetical protein